MINLRPYQEKVIVEARVLLRKHKRILIQIPTGGGKTVVASFMMKSATERGHAAFFLCHRDFLVDQTSKTFAKADIDHSFVAAGRWFNPWAAAHIGMVQTVKQRLEKINKPKFIIWDEAHHIGAASWSAIMEAWPDAIHIGLTATPVRLDGKGLDHHFEAMVIGPSVRQLIDLGALCDYKAYAPSAPDLTAVATKMGDYKIDDIEQIMDRSVIIGDMVQQYRQKAAGLLGVYFCSTIKHSQHTAEMFNAAGIPAKHLDGSHSTFERMQAAQAFANRELMVLTNVDLFGEGYDLAAQAGSDVSIEMVGLARPTQSEGLFLQQVGRALRPEENKMAVILDHAGNIARHGLPDDDREWMLLGRGKAKTGEASMVKDCKECFASIPKMARVCRYCGASQVDGDAEKAGRTVEVEDGDLHEIDKDRIRKAKKLEEWQCETLGELIALGKRRGYRDADKWAGFMWTSKQKRKKEKAHADQMAMAYYETVVRR